MDQYQRTLHLPNNSSLNLIPGQIWGNYKIIHEISRGGMGIVYKAVEKDSNRFVAIKTMQSSQNNTSKRRFLREAQLAANLKHPNIVQLYSAGEINNCLYLVMEYIEGETFEDLLIKNNLPTKKCLEIIYEVSLALSYSHKHNIIHRDVKPANIIILASGEAKIMDFGIAKNIYLKDSLTKSGEIMGTPRYMAPEQLRGGAKNNSPQIDIYALGTILYEVVAQEPMIIGATAMEILFNIENYKPIKLSQHIPQISKDLEIIWQKSTAKKRERYPSMEMFTADLKNFLNNKKIKSSSFFKVRFYKTMLVIACCCAIFFYRNFWNVQKDNTRPYFLLGVAEFESQNYQIAYENFKRVKNLNQATMLPYYIAASMYELENKAYSHSKTIDNEKISLIISMLQKSHKKFPSHKGILFYLAKCFYLINDSAKARMYLQKSIEISPETGAYYTLLGRIDFNEQLYDSSIKNLRKAISLSPENLEPYDIIFQIAYLAPHLQFDTLQLLQYMSSKIFSASNPCLFKRSLEQIRRINYDFYISSFNESPQKKKEAYYLYSIANECIINKKNSVDFIQGKEFFMQTFLNKTKPPIYRYLAAKALTLAHEWEFLYQFVENKENEKDVIGQIIALSALPDLQIHFDPQKIVNYIIYVKDSDLEEKRFLQILLIESIITPFANQKLFTRTEANSKVHSCLSELLKDSDEIVQIAAASSVYCFFDLEEPICKTALSILEKAREKSDSDIRGYVYFYLFESNNCQKNDFYLNIYKQGLLDNSIEIKKTCLSFITKFVRLVVEERMVPIDSPWFRIENHDFLVKIAPELFAITQDSTNDYLSLKASCLWALSLPKDSQVIQTLRNMKKKSPLFRALVARFFVMSTILKEKMVDLDKQKRPDIINAAFKLLQSQKGIPISIDLMKVPDEIKNIMSYIYNEETDISVQANFSFGLQLFIPIEKFLKESDSSKLDEADDYVQASIINAGVSLHYPNVDSLYKRLARYQNHPVASIRQAAINTFFSSRGDDIFKQIPEKEKESDIVVHKGIAYGLHQSILGEYISKRSVLNDNYRYLLQPYKAYELERLYGIYEQKLQQKNPNTSLNIQKITKAIEFDNQQAHLFYERGLFFIAEGKLLNAKKEIQIAIQMSPQYTRYLVTLAELEYSLNNTYESILILSKIENQVRNPFLLERIANLHYKLKNYLLARGVYKNLFIRNPHKKIHMLNIIKTYCQEQDQQNAILYTSWLKQICQHKFSSTNYYDDQLTQSDFDRSDFILINANSLITTLPE